MKSVWLAWSDGDDVGSVTAVYGTAEAACEAMIGGLGPDLVEWRQSVPGPDWALYSEGSAAPVGWVMEVELKK
jgi:hypothetical protein